MNMGSALARIEQKLDDNSDRLFGKAGQKGAITFLHEANEELKDTCGATNTRVTALENWKSGTLKWIAGAVAVLTLEGSAVAFYFHTVVAAVKAATHP